MAAPRYPLTSVIKQSKVISQRLFSTYPARSSYPSASGTSKEARFLQSPETATFPKGYLASAVHAGVKASSPSTKLDVALVVSDRPASAGAAFTRNVFQAAPVQVSRDILRKKAGKGLRAIAVNSGFANAVTGSQGVEDAWAMAKKVDGLLGEGEESSGTLVMSTGVIGQLLPIRKILNGLETSHSTLGSSYEAWLSVARAFMTTDTFPKLRTRSIRLPGSDQEVRFVGIDKGAGMIHPSMGPPSALPHATLLGFIATDANVEPTSLQNALTHAVDRSFNSISIDGDMSTNDTIIALANGASGSPEISEKGTPEDYEVFKRELTSFAEELAQLVVRDGEGATKFVKITVEGAPSYNGAHRIASTISTSALVKCALNGEDANWGRILCAVGYSDARDFTVDPTKVSVSFVPQDGSRELSLLVNGEPEKLDEARAAEILKSEDLEIKVRLGLGKESATYWTCDFSHEYVTINGQYRT